MPVTEALGGNLLVSDIEAVTKANDLCNRYGIDTITVGQGIGLLFEGYERDMIGTDRLTAAGTAPPDPVWGSGGNRQGPGAGNRRS